MNNRGWSPSYDGWNPWPETTRLSNKPCKGDRRGAEIDQQKTIAVLFFPQNISRDYASFVGVITDRGL
jgi:hypothetical protein